jgi:hypothetical protein
MRTLRKQGQYLLRNERYRHLRGCDVTVCYGGNFFTDVIEETTTMGGVRFRGMGWIPMKWFSGGEFYFSQSREYVETHAVSVNYYFGINFRAKYKKYLALKF